MCCQIVVQVTDDLLSRASMTVVNSRPTLTINISTAREHWLEGMLRHEIGGCSASPESSCFLLSVTSTQWLLVAP